MKKQKNIKRIEKKVTPFPIKALKAFLLFLPALIGFSWLTYLKITENTIILTERGIMFAPPRDSQQLALMLFIFTIGYLIFLFVLFFGNIRDALRELFYKLRH